MERGRWSAQDHMDPQHFGFLDPLKYADPWIHGSKYQAKTVKKKNTSLISKHKLQPLKILKLKNFLMSEWIMKF